MTNVLDHAVIDRVAEQAIGLTSTTFFMTDRQTKMIVPNEQLKALIVEKRLPVNGGEAYLPKGDEGGVMKVELVKDE